MKVICDRCGTDHNVNGDHFHDSTRAILVCRGCRTHIRLQLCSSCASPFLSTKKTSSLCPRCAGDSRPYAEISPVKTAPPLKTDPPAALKPGGLVETPTDGRTTGNPAGAYLHFPYLNILSIGEIARIAVEAVRLHTLGPSLIGAWMMMFIAAVSVAFSGSGVFMAAGPAGRTFLHLFPLPLYLFIYYLCAAVSARYIMQRLFTGRINPAGTVSFIARSFIPLVLVNCGLTFGVICLLLIPAGIPSLGPLYFGLLVVPLYCLSLLFLLFSLAGIWFIPSLLAHRAMNFSSVAGALSGFMRRAGFTLCYVVPVLVLAAHVILTPIVMIHRAALSLFTGSGVMVASRTTADVMGAVPLSVGHAVTSIIPARIQGLLASFSGISASASAGGVVAGLGLWIITVLCLGLCLSLLSVMGTHVYIFMERGGRAQQNRSAVLAVLLALCVAGLFFFGRYLR